MGDTDEEDTSGVASFTALPRTKWAEVRKRLEENPVNKKILTLIDSSLTVMVLESESVESTVSVPYSRQSYVFTLLYVYI